MYYILTYYVIVDWGIKMIQGILLLKLKIIIPNSGVVRIFNPWVPKFCCCPFGELGFDIRRYFTYTDPSFPQKSVGSISYFSKICGFHGTHGTHANYAPDYTN